MSGDPQTIDAYLAALSSDVRSALEKLRSDIKAAAPEVEECISYKIPAFRLGGRMLVWFGAGANHCAFYPGALPIRTRMNELQAYHTSKGTIRFSADSPLPAALVHALVSARIAEHGAAKSAKKSAKTSARKSATESTKKSARKSVRQSARKSAKKSARKPAGKSAGLRLGNRPGGR
jgi:uncharacterized protein YdhG (YjbR/CyaY superfamily)